MGSIVDLDTLHFTCERCILLGIIKLTFVGGMV